MPPRSLNLRRVGNRTVRSKRSNTTDTQLARIDVLTATGRSSWLALLAYLAFVTVTTLGVEDIDFFVDNRQTELPLVGVSIPTFSFFVFAPVLGAALYAHLHLHVRKVSEALGPPPLGLPPQIGGAPLEERIRPWLLNDTILRQRRDGAIRPRPLDRLAALTTLLLVWWAGPLVLGIMWVRTWPAHSLGLTLLSVACLLAALYAGFLSWSKMLHDSGRRSVLRTADMTVFVVLLALPLTWLSLANAKGILEIRFPRLVQGHVLPHETLRPGRPEPPWSPWAEERARITGIWFQQLATDKRRDSVVLRFGDVLWNAITGLSQLDSPDLAAARLSVLAPEDADLDTARHRYRTDFCDRRGLEEVLCDRAPSVSYDLPVHTAASRKVWCEERGYHDQAETTCGAFFARLEADFHEEWSTYRTALITAIAKPNLSGLDLRRARLAYAELSGINLRGAQLEEADLTGARLEEADLSTASMEGALLTDARMERATLESARLANADLRSAEFKGANLRGARLQNVFANGARFEGANLSGAWLDGAHLNHARLDDADLDSARLFETWLVGASLKGASVFNARWKGAILRRAHLSGLNLGSAELEEVFLREARLEKVVLSSAQLNGSDLSYSRLLGTAQDTINLESTDLRATMNAGGALRFVDLRHAVFSATSDLRDSFGDSTVLLPDSIEPPCQWAREELADATFFGRWRGWIEAGPEPWAWYDTAPEAWRDVAPEPPPKGCSWHE